MARILPNMPLDAQAMTLENRDEVTEVLVAQVNLLLEKLFDNSAQDVSQVDQLAIVVSLRKIIGSSRLLDLEKVHR